MKDEDKKEFINIINEGFEQVVLPHIIEMKEDISKLKEDVSTLKENVSTLKEDMTEVKEGLGRVERRQEAEQGMLDTHDQRIGVLEKKLA